LWDHKKRTIGRKGYTGWVKKRTGRRKKSKETHRQH